MSQPKTVKALIASAKDQFLSIDDGQRLKWQSEAMYAMQIIGGKGKSAKLLREADQNSIRNAIINVASVGLSLNPTLGLAYLVPRDGLCCLDVSYKGLVQLATDSGAIRYVRGAAVYENDHFTYRGPDEKPTHEFNPFASIEERGDLIGVYCFVKTSDGDILAGVMSRDEIEKIRKLSKAPDSPAWRNFYDQMALKALIKREQKLWPKSARESMAPALKVLNDQDGLRDEYLSATYHEMPRAISDETVEHETEESEADTPEEPETAPTGLSDGQKRIIVAKLAAANMDDQSLLSNFKVSSLDEIPGNKVNDVLAWIEEAA